MLGSYPCLPQQRGCDPLLGTTLSALQHKDTAVSNGWLPQQPGRSPCLGKMLPPQHKADAESYDSMPQQRGFDPVFSATSPLQHKQWSGLYGVPPQSSIFRRCMLSASVYWKREKIKQQTKTHRQTQKQKQKTTTTTKETEKESLKCLTCSHTNLEMRGCSILNGHIALFFKDGKFRVSKRLRSQVLRQR